ncbi:putative UDP-glucuronosyltransferase ugt-48 [Aphelenchoides besseyi]|nr:putative UDP-glucuronosyltransferase ugt-48 [Aphelenchoides besseyi]
MASRMMLFCPAIVPFVLLPAVSAERFLFISTNLGHSHIGFTGRLADILVDAGHEVDFVIPLFNHFITSNGTKKANVTRVELTATAELEEQMKNMKWWNDVFENKKIPAESEKFKNMMAMYCESKRFLPVLVNGFQTELLEKLRSRNYKIGFALPLTDYTSYVHGIPTDYNNIPMMANQEQINPISSLADRAVNAIMFWRTNLKMKPRPVWKVMQKLVSPNFPSSEEIMRRVDFVWLNTNKFINFPRSLPAKVKQIGGIGMETLQKLDQTFTDIFDRASKGVILVSFGSIVNTDHVKPEIRDAFLDAFGQFPHYQFVWKVTNANGNNLTHLTSAHYKNVHAVNWMNQPSILAHPHTVAFISHMGSKSNFTSERQELNAMFTGLNSLNEAARFGVPVVSIPFFADQPFNTAVIVKRKLGVFVDRRHITTSTVADAIRTILEDPSYLKVAKEVSLKMADDPFSLRDVFVRHVEFSARNGPMNEFELPASQSSFIQQHSFDLLALFTFSIFTLLLSLVLILKSTARLCTKLLQRYGQKKEKETA